MTADDQEPLEATDNTVEGSDQDAAEPIESPNESPGQEADVEPGIADASDLAAEPSEGSQAETTTDSPDLSDPASESGSELNPEAAVQAATARRMHASAPYVSWGGRVLAYLIDVVPILVFGFFVNLIVKSTETTSLEVIGRNAGHDIQAEVTHTSALGIAIQVLAFVVILAYWFWNKGYREGTTGKSIGKQALGFTTLDEATRNPIGAKTGCIRVLLLFVDFFICYIGVLWPLWDVKKQTFLSDRFTNAIVLRD